MAYFKLIALYNDKEHSLLGVLAEDDGEAYFYTSDVARMLGNHAVHDQFWLYSRPLEGMVFYESPCTLWMIRIDHLIHQLQQIQSPQARVLIHLLTRGIVRDLPNQRSIPKVIQSTDGYGITFPSWLSEFTINYGPK